MNAPTSCDLDAIRQHFDHFRPHQTDSFERSRSCCSAHGPANDVPALLDEVERLRARVAELTTDRDAWRADRNKLARECADLRDAANTARADERERIANWFVTQGDLWRINQRSEARCEWDWAADHIRNDVPETRAES